jgi:hypothetical protein
MSTDPHEPQVLASVSAETEAAMIVAALAEHGIEASTTGGIIAGFRAEVPGHIDIIVRQEQLAKAQQAYVQIQAEMFDSDSEIDWSQVDVGEPED